MGNSQRRRWTVLLTALVLTLAAIYLGPAPAEVVEVSDRGASAAAALAAPQRAAELAPIFEEEASADPFEKRTWDEPPPPPPYVAELVPVERTVAPVVVEPAAPPPLPYRYVGRFSDDGGAVIYLARGDVTVLARVGETLDETYKVGALHLRGIEFEHLPTGTKQTLPIPESE